MSARVLDPLRLDVQAFAKEAAELEGHWPLRRFQRIAEAVHSEATPADGDLVVWSARGEQRAARGAEAETWLHLKAATRLPLQCQRCLQPVETGLEIDRWFRFVAGEDAAAQVDADSEDDVLAMTRALDLHDLVEDELLLALPLVPRHDRCPSPLSVPSEALVEVEERPKAFAALAALKRGGPLN